MFVGCGEAAKRKSTVVRERPALHKQENKEKQMKLVIAAVIIFVGSTITASAWPCGLLTQLFDPSCNQPPPSAQQMLAADVATCRTVKMPLESCLAYLQNQRNAQFARNLAIYNARKAIIDAPSAPVYQPPQTVIVRRLFTCANANLIGC